VHDALEIDRVGGKGRPECGMFEPVLKDGKAPSYVVVVRRASLSETLSVKLHTN